MSCKRRTLSPSNVLRWKQEMAKSMNKESDLEDVENRESVNSRIKKFMTLKESIKNTDKKVQNWINQTSKLLESNSNIDRNYDKLMLEVSDLNTKISDNTRIDVMRKQELKDFQSARANKSKKQWDDCLVEIGNYADDFCRWTTEYSRNILLKNIENHNEECKKIGNELAILKEELDDMKGEHSLDNIKANVDIENLQGLNTVISEIKSDNNNLTQIVRSTDDMFKKIQIKIQQNRNAVTEYKTKEKIKMF